VSPGVFFVPLSPECTLAGKDLADEFGQGGVPGTHAAFPDGQSKWLEMMKTKGIKDATYLAAIRHIRMQTRENGIDAALKTTDSDGDDDTGAKLAQILDGDDPPRASSERESESKSKSSKKELDALLFCDRKGIGQQYAAQAGYPIICIPIGLDDEGMPVGLSFQGHAYSEPTLIRWASAVEYMWNLESGWRPTPAFRKLNAKNIPVEEPSMV
jgi:amidase